MRLEDEIKATQFQSEVHKAHLNILFTASWLRNRVAATIKPFDLSPEQFNVLRIVRGQKKQGIRAKDISLRMLERNSNTTRIIDRLEGKGLLQRLPSERDRRERLIVLTDEGYALLTEIDVSWEYDNPHTAPISEEEAKIVSDLLDKMREE